MSILPENSPFHAKNFLEGPKEDNSLLSSKNSLIKGTRPVFSNPEEENVFNKFCEKPAFESKVTEVTKKGSIYEPPVVVHEKPKDTRNGEKHFYHETERKPLILPVVIEV